MLSGFARPVRHLPAPSPHDTMSWMSKFIREGQYDYRLRALAEKLVADLWPHDYLSEYAAVLNWARANIRYSRDPRTIEQVKTPAVIVETKTGDCVTTDTEIIVVDSRGFYRIIAVGALRDSYSQYRALSYNFERGSWEFKPILAWADKGKQEVYKIRLTTGYYARVTSGHELLLWSNEDDRWEKRRLSDACQSVVREDGRRYFKRGMTVLAARQIPSLNIESGVSADQLWIGGAYTAEGWHEGSHTGIARSGEDRIDVGVRLERLGVTSRYQEPRPGTGGYFDLHAHDVTRWLHAFGSRAIEKHFIWDLMSCSKEDIETLVGGYSWGDSWHNHNKVESHRCHVFMHSTISNELARQLKLAHMILGRPLSANLVQNHGGLGRNPIWRMWESTGARYQEKLPGLTNVGVRGAWYDGMDDVCDIEVADNHNFVLANGMLAHNCDDLSVLVGTLVGLLGGKVRLVAGGFTAGEKAPLSHVWLEAWEPTSGAWVVLDPVPGRKVNQMLGRVKKALVMEVLQ